MKILHVIDYYMPGMGYQENLLPKWNSFQNNDVNIITGDRYQPIPDYDKSWGKVLGDRICGTGRTKENGVQIIRLEVSFEIKGKPWFKNLRYEIEKCNPDVIIIHGTTSFNFYRVPFISKRLKLPCMADNHMVFHVIQKNLINKIFIRIHRLLVKKIYSKLIYKFIGVTKETCEYLVNYEKVPKNKVYHLPLGVDETIFNSNYHSDIIKKDNSSKIVMQTGKLSEDKKPQWLADAVIKNLINSLNVECLFVGGGSEKIRKYIEKIFLENGYASKLKFVEFVNASKLPDFYRKADICVYPDGTSLSALEAAACGCAVIMADYDASIDKVKNGIGLVYKTGDIDDLSEKIDLLVKDNDYREQIILSSINSIRNNYSYSQISKQLINLCKESIKNINK